MSVPDIVTLLKGLDVTLTYEDIKTWKQLRARIFRVRESLEKGGDRTEIIAELESIICEVERLTVVSKVTVKRVLDDCLNKIKALEPTKQDEGAKNPVLLDLLQQMKVLI